MPKVLLSSKSRLFHFVIYPDSSSYDGTNFLKSFDPSSRFVPFFPMEVDFAYILHDSDVDDLGSPLKSHYHLVLRLSSPRSYLSVCKTLGLPTSSVSLPDSDRSSNLSFRYMSRYLIHLDSPKKYQYNPSSVISNFDISQYFDVASSDRQSSAFLELLELVLLPSSTKRSVAVYAAQSGLLSYYRMYYRILWDISYENDIKGWMERTSEEQDENFKNLCESVDKFFPL